MRRGELASPATTMSPAVLGASGGEVVGGSGGGFGDFLTPGGGAASVVEGEVESLEVEEMFSEFDEVGSEVEAKREAGAVRLIFPLYNYEEGTEEQWAWNVCGGLIGGPRGTRFCTKIIENLKFPHCGVASHAAHKADLKKGHGYIPSVNDRSNTESAFLSPTLSGERFPRPKHPISSLLFLWRLR